MYDGLRVSSPRNNTTKYFSAGGGNTPQKQSTNVRKGGGSDATINVQKRLRVYVYACVGPPAQCASKKEGATQAQTYKKG